MDGNALFEFLGRGFILLAVAAVIGWRFYDAQLGWRFWRGVFVLLLAMALVGLGPAWRWIHLGVESEDRVAPVMAALTTMEATVDHSPEDEPVALVAAPSVEISSSSWSIGKLLAWLWLAGVAVGLWRLAASRRRLSILLAEATPLKIDGEMVLESTAVSAPLCFGLLRPGIVVPSGFGEWPAQERRMALHHESCHVESRDSLWQWLASLMAIMHWPNPLAWLALRRLERTRELAVDAEVLRSGVSRTAYSELLVRLASGGQRQEQQIAVPAAIAMARKSTVPLRVDRILKGRQSGKVAMGPLLWLALGFLSGVAVTLGVTSLGNQKSASGEDFAGAGAAGELFTHVYTVPPNFVPTIADPASSDEDPFAPKSDSTPSLRRPPKEWLMECGISFPKGSSAVYDPSKSQIIIRNTLENMELVEALIDSILQESQNRTQVYLTSKVVEGPSGFAGMDWLVPDADSGMVAGVFTDPQFQFVIRKLNQEKGVDLMTAPSIMIRNGQKGHVEISDQPGVKFLLEATPVVGSDGFTVDLSLQVGPDAERGTFSITIWDGQTVAWTESVEGGRVRATFVTARLMDPAGMPVHPEPAAIPPASNSSISDLEP